MSDQPHKYTPDPQWPGSGCTICGRQRLPTHVWTAPQAKQQADQQAIDHVRVQAHRAASFFVVQVLDAAARAEGFDSYRDSDWSPDVAAITQQLADALAAPYSLIKDQEGEGT